MTLSFVEVDSKNPPRSSVIWLHGLGANGYDFEPIVPELKLPEELAVRFIFPHAPIMPVTLNNGMYMPAWFDLYDLHVDMRYDEAGIERAAESVSVLIENEIQRGIPSNRIALVGFSQGGALALYTGLRYQKPLASLIGLSTFLPHYEKFQALTNPNNETTPVFIGHGSFDTLVPVSWGKATADSLKTYGHPVTWHEYPIEHAVSSEETHHLHLFFKKILS